MSNNEEGFKIVDKRKSDNNEINDKVKNKSQEPPEAQPEPKTSRPEVYEATFENHLMQLATQALISIGVIPNPVTNKAEEDLSSAKYFIDLLEIFQDKTRGNLTNNEESMLKDILYDLRMRYVQKLKKK